MREGKVGSKTLHKSGNGEEISEIISLASSVECDEKNQTNKSSTLQDAPIFFDSSEQKVCTKEDVSTDMEIERVTCHVVNKEASLLSENKNPDAPAQDSKAVDVEKSEVVAVEPSRQRTLPTWMLIGKDNDECKEASNKPLKKTKHSGNEKKNEVENSGQNEGNMRRNDVQQITKNSVKRVKIDSRNVSKKKQYHSVSQEYDDHSELNEKNLEPSVNYEEGDLKQNSNKYTPSKSDVCAEVAASCSAYAKETPLKCDENLHGVSDDDSASGQNSPDKKNTPKSSPVKGLVQSNDIERDEDRKKQRQSCHFGSNCYRRNPAHKKEFSHPGDEDYSPPDNDASDDDDERPQCEHGIDCYRKNPQHRKAYKHTRIPQPRRRAARAKRKRNDFDDNDSEDEYDANDPFLNDDSSDDYAPTDDDTDSPLDDDAVEEQDTKRMLKEAKKFTKNREG